MDGNWDKSRLSKLMGATYTSGAGMSHHEANILKQVMEDGAYKVYEDTTGEYQKVEILLKDSKLIVLNKEVSKLTRTERYKKLQILSSDNQPLDEMELLAQDHISSNPTYRFFYHHTILGTGRGNIGLFLAYKLLDMTVDTRYLAGSDVDEEVLKAIKEVTTQKNY